MFRVMYVYFLLLLIVSNVYSETVLLRNGNILRGKLKSQSLNEIVIIIDTNEQKISKDLVFRVLYRDMSQTEAKGALLAEIKKLNPKEREKLISEMKDKSIVSKIETKPNTDKPVKEDVIANTKELAIDVNTKSESEKGKVNVITKWGLVWRSALIPGWGHAKAEYYKTGFFYGTVFLGSIFSAAYFSNQLNSAIKERDEKINTNTFLTLGVGGPASALLLFAGGASSTTQDEQRILGYRALLYSSLGVMSSVYVIQLVNVYILGVSIEKSKQTGFNYYMMPEISALSKQLEMQHVVSYTIRF